MAESEAPTKPFTYKNISCRKWRPGNPAGMFPATCPHCATTHLSIADKHAVSR